MPRVLVTPELSRRRGAHLSLLSDAGFEVYVPPDGTNLMDPATLIAQLQGVSAAMAGMEPYNALVLRQVRGLRVVARTGVGYDAVDLEAATAARVVVTITPGTNEHSVAEQAIALITGVFRGFPLRDQNVRRGAWVRKALPRLWGRTLGLLGLGRIGRAIAPRARGLGLSILAYDPVPSLEFAAAHGIRYVEFETLLAESDIVSLHLPVTEQTRDLMNARTLAMMKPGSVLINTARGQLVDEGALYEALTSGRLWAAGLDVFKQEPLPVDHPLLSLPNVLVCPHTGGIDEESEYAMCTMAAECILDLHRGRMPAGCVVNGDVAPGWTW